MSLPSLQKYHKDAYPTINPRRPELSQAGKTVMVAGGSTGIGFAISRSFALANASRVIILGRRPEVAEDAATKIRQEIGTPPIVEARAIDISSLEQIGKLWSDLESENIYIDILVLSASAYGKIAPILDMGSEITWADFETNVRSPLYLTERFYKQTTGTGQKYLVNISSIAAYMWASMGPERPTYGLTKNAATLLMQQIAKDTDPKNMQVVSFHPGGVLSESSRKLGVSEDSGLLLDHENLPGHTAVWAATKEAEFLHGRFVLANWDMDEVKNGIVGRQIREDANFLKVGIEGLSENMGGIIF